MQGLQPRDPPLCLTTCPGGTRGQKQVLSMHSPTEPTLVDRRGLDTQGSGAWMAHTQEVFSDWSEASGSAWRPPLAEKQGRWGCRTQMELELELWPRSDLS